MATFNHDVSRSGFRAALISVEINFRIFAEAKNLHRSGGDLRRGRAAKTATEIYMRANYKVSANMYILRAFL